MILEIFGVIASILYIWLEIKQKRIMWVVGAVSAVVYSVIFGVNLLYASMGIQLFYVFISIYGWIKWSRESSLDEGVIRKLSLTSILISVFFTMALFVVLTYILKNYSKDPYPVFDALLASLSITASIWLSKKYIEQWFLWMVVNFFSVILYRSMNLYPTSLLYVIYFTGSVIGYLKWRKFKHVLN